jgi:hypothetical protein
MIETQDEMVTTDQGVELLESLCVWSEVMDAWIDKDDKVVCAEGDIMSSDYRDDNYNYCEDTDEYHHHEYSWWCEVNEVHYSDNEISTESYCGVVGHEDSFANSDYYVWVERGCASDHWLYSDDAIYCEDIQSYVHDDDSHYCEHNECSYYHESNCGGGNDIINSYHTSSRFIENHNQLWLKSDFSIGFEVEKTEFETEDYGTASDQGDDVGEYPFFAGFETDSSCGVEAVSHVFPLSPPRSKWRKEVFDMMNDASCIINSDADIKCGGHITVSVNPNFFKGDAYDVVNAVKPKLALLYALYRYRLKRSYCAQNKPVKKENNAKYSPVNVKSGNRIEFRIPSRVKNVKQLKLRYDFMYSMFYYTFKEETSFEDFCIKVRPILMKMYEGNLDKVNMVYSYAQDFKKYLASEEVSPNIEQFINPKQND